MKNEQEDSTVLFFPVAMLSRLSDPTHRVLWARQAQHIKMLRISQGKHISVSMRLTTATVRKRESHQVPSMMRRCSLLRLLLPPATCHSDISLPPMNTINPLTTTIPSHYGWCRISMGRTRNGTILRKFRRTGCRRVQ